MITVKIEGNKQITKNLRRKLKKGLRDMSSDLTQELRNETPVDTGYAKSRWRKRNTKDGAVIQNDADYIEYLEDGHSKQAPNGMFKPALNKIKHKIKSYFK